MRFLCLITLAIVLATVAPAGAATVTVYSNGFDNNEVFGTGVGGNLYGAGVAESVQSLSGVGHVGNQFSGNLLRNDTTGTATVLYLSNLPAHSSVKINFLFAFIDSWDSINGSPAPDYFNVKVDTVYPLQITAANASGNVTYGGDQIGYAYYGWNGSWPDRAFDMSNEPALTLAHSASSLYVYFYASGGGWQAGIDESWAIDNLKVTVEATPVPIPPTIALLGAGLVGIAGVRRRFRK